MRPSRNRKKAGRSIWIRRLRPGPDIFQALLTEELPTCATAQHARLTIRPPITPYARFRALSNSSGATSPETRANSSIWMNDCIDDARPLLLGKWFRAIRVIGGMAIDRANE